MIVQNNLLWGYNVFSQGMDNLIETIRMNIANSKRFTILPLNAWKLYFGEQNENYKNIFNGFNCIIPDGQSIVFASQLLNKRKIDYISGAELMMELIELCNVNNYSIFFLGSPQELLDKVHDKIKKKFPGITKVGFQHGYYELKEEEAIVNEIANFKPDFLFIAFGSPRKELFIHKYQRILNSKILMGVGGSYEVFVGDKKINTFTKKLGLRWLIRLIQDPVRLWKRCAISNSYLLYMLLRGLLRMN